MTTKTSNNIGVIDIGTNTTKCAIFCAKSYKIMLLENKSAKAQDFVQQQPNDIDTKTIEENIYSLINQAITHCVLPQNIKILATQGLRDAPDKQRQTLINNVSNQTQKKWGTSIEIDIISPKKEAELAVKGILSTRKIKNNAIIIEAGGASTEVSFIESQDGRNTIKKTISIPIGNTNFNKETHKSIILEKLQELDLGRLDKTQVIINAVAAYHVIKKHYRLPNIKDVESKSVKKHDFMKKLKSITYSSKNIGYETSKIIQTILENTDLSDFATITATREGVKEGYLLTKIYENTQEQIHSFFNTKNKKLPYTNRTINFMSKNKGIKR